MLGVDRVLLAPVDAEVDAPKLLLEVDGALLPTSLADASEPDHLLSESPLEAGALVRAEDTDPEVADVELLPRCPIADEALSPTFADALLEANTLKESPLEAGALSAAGGIDPEVADPELLLESSTAGGLFRPA